MVHTDLGNRLNESWGAAYVVTWYTQLVAALGAGGAASFDAIGLSFYPHWGAGPTTNIARLGAVRAAFPDKQIFLAECSWPYQGAASPGDEFPVSRDGQVSFSASESARDEGTRACTL
jgi:arabinogalactan endo-1,4-beta-galactosidase